MVVLCDMDDVLNNLLEQWVKYLNAESGRDLKLDDIKDFDIKCSYPELPDSQIFRPLREAWFWDEVEPKEDAIESTKMVQDLGHELYIVTSSWYNSIKPKTEGFLNKYYPHIDWSHVIVAQHKKMIKGDVLIDDNFNNLIDGDWEKILFDAPHNRSINESQYGMVRARDWYEVLIELRGIDAMRKYSNRFVGVKNTRKGDVV